MYNFRAVRHGKTATRTRLAAVNTHFSDTTRRDIIAPKTLMDNAALREMARDCYGYGRSGAPYWFIGPEQGQGRDDLCLRFEAWKKLDHDGLCDCREFHQCIGEPRFHRKKKPALQKTWDKLIVLLKAFKGERIDDQEARRRYQRDELGTLNGETCVIGYRVLRPMT